MDPLDGPDAIDEHDECDRRLIDAALLLVLWRCASTDETAAGSRLRLMKLAFLASRRFAEESIHALNVRFYRWRYGPMSNDVYEIWERLQRAGLMEEEEVWSLTMSGELLAQGFYDEVLGEEGNAPVKAVLDEVADKWRSAWSAQPLINHIYDLPLSIDGSGPAIRDMPEGSDFDVPLTASEASVSLEVSYSWVETLALSLNPEAMMMLNAAVEDFRAGRYVVA